VQAALDAMMRVLARLDGPQLNWVEGGA